MAGFIQIMDIQTSRIDEVEALARQMADERAEAFLARRSTVTADRDKPGHYFIVVEFDSYEDAMENSADPVTSRYAEKMTTLLDRPPVFYNLDVHDVLEVG